MKTEFRATELATLFGGTGTLPAEDIVITGFKTDSRDAQPGDLFIAIRGENVDGRDYLSKTQASIALAEPGHPLVDNPPLPIIVVDNVVEALADFGRALRSRFHGPVIGVTGSVGKSTVKELIAAALSPLGEVVKTEGNRNTEYTAPLLWAEVGPETKAVVVEMGMRGLGQIAHLASIARPTIAVITNIGVTHLSELGSVENIARAKAELIEGLIPPAPAAADAVVKGFEAHCTNVGRGGSSPTSPTTATAIFWADDPWRALLEETTARVGAERGLFGTGQDARETHGLEARATHYQAADWTSSLTTIALANSRQSSVELVVNLPVVGRHFALGAAAAILAAQAAGVDPVEAAQALGQVQLPPMRMAIREQNGITWVLDMYNAAPASTIAALETVAEVAKGPKYAVLGEMRELGDATEEGHRQVGEALARLGFSAAITLDAGAPEEPKTSREGGDGSCPASGPTQYILNAAIDAGMSESNLTHAASFEEVRAWLRDRKQGDTILVKGSRGVELEKVVPNGLASA